MRLAEDVRGCRYASASGVPRYLGAETKEAKKFHTNWTKNGDNFRTVLGLALTKIESRLGLHLLGSEWGPNEVQKA